MYSAYVKFPKHSSMDSRMIQMLRMPILAALTVFVVPSFPTGSAAATRALHCEDRSDCPKGWYCSIRPGHEKGRCVAIRSARRMTTIVCEDSQDCPPGRFCRVRPGHETGRCVSR